MTDASTESVPVKAAPHLGPGMAVYLALLLQVTISSGTFLVAKRAMAEIGPIALLSCRFALSAALFALILLATSGPMLPPRASFKRVLFLGFLAGPLNQGFFFVGLARSTPAHAALLYALTPLGVYVYSVFRGRERMSAKSLVGIGVAFVGVVVLLLGRGLRATQGPLIGDLIILGAVAAWVLYTTEGKSFTVQHGPLRATAWSMIAASFWTLPLAVFLVSPSQIFSVSAVTLGGIVYLAVLTSVVAYVLWYFALSRMDASKVAVFANLQPVLTALGAWGFQGEKLTWEIGVGGALVLLGVRFTQIP